MAPLAPTFGTVRSAAPGHYAACRLGCASAVTRSRVPEPGESHHSQGCPDLMGGSTEGWGAKGTDLGTDFDLRGVFTVLLA